MQKLYYNEQGWVCERYPYNFPIYDENLYIWVEDLTYEKTLQIPFGKAWRDEINRLEQIVNGG